jgi:NAD(P)H-hydrate epimerase
MTEPLAETAGHAIAFEARAAILDLLARRDAVALGPGLSLDPETQDLVRELVAEVSHPMVVDADALSALAGHLDVLDGAAGPRIMTHPGEMAQMLRRRWRVQGDRLRDGAGLRATASRSPRAQGAGTVTPPDGRVFINHRQPGDGHGGRVTPSPV